MAAFIARAIGAVTGNPVFDLDGRFHFDDFLAEYPSGLSAHLQTRLTTNTMPAGTTTQLTAVRITP